jgi:adenylate kinase
LRLPRCVLILGAPASGKGTQAGLLAQKEDAPHISLGEILRSDVVRGGVYGKEAADFVSKGLPIPVSLMSRILRERLSQNDVRSGFIGDGLVRTVEQGHELNRIFADCDLQLSTVLHLVVPKSEIIRRSQDRLVCVRCGAIYRGRNDGTPLSQYCDVDGERLVSRSDDSIELFERRLTIYYKNAAEINQYYEQIGILRRVDGTGTIDLVQRKIRESFQNYSVIG